MINENRIYTIGEVMAITGRSRKTLLKFAASGILPLFKEAGRWYLRGSDLVHFLGTESR